MRRTEAFYVMVSLLIVSGAVGCSAPRDVPVEAADSQTAVEPSTSSIDSDSTSLADLVPNGKTPLENLVTGGQPSADQLADLAHRGLSTVINLRIEGENGNTDSELVESLGMTYVSIPIAGADDLTEANAQRLAGALEQATSPTLLHCGSGNRVGALLAMKAFYIDEMPAEDALAVGKAAGVTRLEPELRSKLGLPES